MKNHILYKANLLLLLLLFSVWTSAQKNKINEGETPKNVILLIGDGMGITQIYAAMNASAERLNITRCTYSALVTTNSADNDITDSGAGGTAIATGIKTYNGAIGVAPNKEPATSILKIAEQHGLSTGIVVTCDVTHATPASFIANVDNRGQAEDIAAEYLKTDVDVFIGGGYNAFAKRKDEKNFIDSLKFRKYDIALSIDEVAAYKGKKLAGLLYAEHPPKYSEGRGNMLTVATSKALDMLSTNKKGFFLMVEGSQIDWGGHNNDIDYIVNEMLDFDRTVGLALDFAEKNPGTLVIVTSDHETGGLTLIESDTDKGKMKPAFSTKHHTAAPVPLFAFGTGASNFRGFMDNTDIFKTLITVYNFNTTL